jgi:hypothetical protein
MPNKYAFISGGKAVTLNDLDDFLDWLVSEGQAGAASIKQAHKQVPWLYRATDIRKNAVANIPFKIYRGEEEIDSSANYQNAVGFLPNPFRLLREIEGSLTLTGRAYLWNTHNRVAVLDLRYLVPTTVRPRITEARGLVGWERNTGSGWRDVPLEDIVYLWGDDTFVELGPPEAAPGIAALIASGLLISIDEFATKFAARGMIKATLIKVPRGTDKDERSRIRKWFQKRILGVENTGAVETMEADTVEAHTIGEGLSELAEVELTTEKQHDIATALGVPVTKLFSGEASGLGGGGVVEQDDRNFYTETAIPEASFIAAELNRQVFTWGGMDFTLRFHPETMDIFQTDEAQRAGAVKTYVEAGYELSTASEILGVELPEGMEYADLDVEPEPVPPQFISNPEPPDEPDDRKAKADERRWRSVALRQLKAGKPAMYNFESEYIPTGRHAQIITALEVATTPQEVKAAFAARFQGIPFYP